MHNKTPLVSIWSITYNHKDYIKECLNGIVNQKTNFNYEFIIGDDCSTDGTSEILMEYANKYPHIIKPIINKKNLGVKQNSFEIVYPKLTGKYIAICEGDDYWTDPYKLQKQVDFLEANPDVNVCFHRTELLKNNSKKLQPVPSPFETEKFDYIELIRHHNFIATASVVLRKPKDFIIPQWFYQTSFGDLAMYKIATQEGKKIQCINEVMSIYRIHNAGVWSGIQQKKAVTNYLNFYLIIFPVLNPLEKKEASKKIKKQLRQLAAIKFPKSRLVAIFYYLILLLKHIKYL